ncbi:homoserine/threonine efflux protein [Streptomyces noursei ATCC 11455]|uniref:LysE family translocator n=1 Tax=Streptomyces noursei TaxID=1971 RepID=UPI00081C30C0|nr:homoserine/threonine efflux protein [Streptomyces noursei ATCC 11455]
MVSADRLPAFAAVSFLLIVVPGPSVLFVIGRALAQGRRAALTTVVGNTLGAHVLIVAVAVAVALGTGAVVERSVVVFKLPQFVDRGQGHVAGQMLLLGLVFNVIAMASDSVWGLVAATARTWFARSPRRLSPVGGAGGLTMIGLGVTVAVTGRKD